MAENKNVGASQQELNFDELGEINGGANIPVGGIATLSSGDISFINNISTMTHTAANEELAKQLCNKLNTSDPLQAGFFKKIWDWIRGK